MSLINRIKRTAVAGVGLTLCLSFPGCEMTDADLLGLGLHGLAVDAERQGRDGTGTEYLSQFAYGMGQREHERKVAERGRSQINIYTQPQGQPQTMQPQPIRYPVYAKFRNGTGKFLPNYFAVDFNNDGIIDGWQIFMDGNFLDARKYNEYNIQRNIPIPETHLAPGTFQIIRDAYSRINHVIVYRN